MILPGLLLKLASFIAFIQYLQLLLCIEPQAPSPLFAFLPLKKRIRQHGRRNYHEVRIASIAKRDSSIYSSPIKVQLTSPKYVSPYSDKASFLNDLAAKMAAGPPKKPIGLVKKPALDAVSQDLPTQASDAQKNLGELLKATAGKNTNDSAEAEAQKDP